MPSLSLRINLDPDGRIGPGKIELLEQIAAFGSISRRRARMGMSYKRAWDLVEEMNTIFGKPVVAAQTGGKQGGGAQLTPVGQAVVSRFRAIEESAASAAEQHVARCRRRSKLRKAVPPEGASFSMAPARTAAGSLAVRVSPCRI